MSVCASLTAVVGRTPSSRFIVVGICAAYSAERGQKCWIRRSRRRGAAPVWRRAANALGATAPQGAGRVGIDASPRFYRWFGALLMPGSDSWTPSLQTVLGATAGSFMVANAFFEHIGSSGGFLWLLAWGLVGGVNKILIEYQSAGSGERARKTGHECPSGTGRVNNQSALDSERISRATPFHVPRAPKTEARARQDGGRRVARQQVRSTPVGAPAGPVMAYPGGDSEVRIEIPIGRSTAIAMALRKRVVGEPARQRSEIRGLPHRGLAVHRSSARARSFGRQGQQVESSADRWCRGLRVARPSRAARSLVPADALPLRTVEVESREHGPGFLPAPETRSAMGWSDKPASRARDRPSRPGTRTRAGHALAAAQREIPMGARMGHIARRAPADRPALAQPIASCHRTAVLPMKPAPDRPSEHRDRGARRRP